jgi:hypothetical protein
MGSHTQFHHPEQGLATSMALETEKTIAKPIFSAGKACNNGGTIILLDPEYIIGQALDLTFFQSVDFIIRGKIHFT